MLAQTNKPAEMVADLVRSAKEAGGRATSRRSSSIVRPLPKTSASRSPRLHPCPARIPWPTRRATRRKPRSERNAPRRSRDRPHPGEVRRHGRAADQRGSDGEGGRKHDPCPGSNRRGVLRGDRRCTECQHVLRQDSGVLSPVRLRRDGTTLAQGLVGGVRVSARRPHFEPGGPCGRARGAAPVRFRHIRCRPETSNRAGR